MPQEISGPQAVTPVRPVAPYIGGKRNLAGRLVRLIQATPHEAYAEPFVGMGGVFLRRSVRPKAEIINDWSRDVSNFFRVLQAHRGPLLDELRFQLTGRAEFERQMAVDPDTLTDLQRAARFFYLQRTSFGGKVAGRHFGVDVGRARFDVTKLEPLVHALHRRLADVTIERLPWSRFIARYDRPGTLFYLDPPYYGCEGDYGAGLFSREEFVEMAQILAGLKGRFILSLNDRPEVRQIFGGFEILGAETTYSVGVAPTKANEVIITGPR